MEKEIRYVRSAIEDPDPTYPNLHKSFFEGSNMDFPILSASMY